jgi:hypothetical protein
MGGIAWWGVREREKEWEGLYREEIRKRSEARKDDDAFVAE